MFKVYSEGFSMNLDNGYTISVQFSPFNMCSNRQYEKEYREQLINKRLHTYPECPNAEIAVIDTITGDFVPIDGEDVTGYQTVANLIKLINNVYDYPNTDSKMIENEALEVIDNGV